jgi:hypothetical protein
MPGWRSSVVSSAISALSDAVPSRRTLRAAASGAPSARRGSWRRWRRSRLLLLDARAHVLDDRGVLAAQALELHHLLGQVAAADVQGAAGFGAQVGDVGDDRRAAGSSGAGPSRLRPAPSSTGSWLAASSSASLLTLATRPFWPDTGITWCLRRPRISAVVARCRSICACTWGRAERVPHGVDLVQHHQARIGVLVLGDQVLAPDRQVGLGHAGVGARMNTTACACGIRLTVSSGSAPMAFRPGCRGSPGPA